MSFIKLNELMYNNALVSLRATSFTSLQAALGLAYLTEAAGVASSLAESSALVHGRRRVRGCDVHGQHVARDGGCTHVVAWRRTKTGRSDEGELRRRTDRRAFIGRISVGSDGKLRPCIRACDIRSAGWGRSARKPAAASESSQLSVASPPVRTSMASKRTI
jgi:hypothetical protein